MPTSAIYSDSDQVALILLFDRFGNGRGEFMVIENNVNAVGTKGWQRVSWGAVFAAVAVVLALQLFFGALGLSFGAGSIDPLEEQNPMAGLGIGTLIWFMVTSLISLFAGGWVAGRLAGTPQRFDGAIHGVLGWSVATLATFYLLSTAVGGLIRGTSGAVGRVFSAVSSGMGGVSGEIARQGVQAFQGTDLDLSDLKREARSLLSQTGKRELNPNRLERSGRAAVDDAQGTARTAAESPQTADQELDSLIDRIFARAEGAVDAVDKEAIVNVLVARTDMTREQASSTVDQWAVTAAQAREKFNQAKAEAERKAREAGDVLARATSRAAVFAAIAMLLGAAAAAFGGSLGAPRVFASQRPL